MMSSSGGKLYVKIGKKIKRIIFFWKEAGSAKMSNRQTLTKEQTLEKLQVIQFLPHL